MAAPSDALRIGTPAETADALTRSHLADGRVVGWYGDPGVVVDAELDRPVPPALAARYGTEDFWTRWTRTECAAKLADVPIALWLAAHGLDAGRDENWRGYRFSTRLLSDSSSPPVVVTLGWSVDPTRG